jgi:tetratricopeptide (TPR) repeat protein
MNKQDDLGEKIRELVRQREFDVALSECELAIVEWSTADVHHALSLRGYVRWRRGEKHSALADYRLAALLAPRWAGHEHGLMRHSVDLARYEDAIEAADRLLAIEKERNSEAFVESARLHQLFCFAKLSRREDFERTALSVGTPELVRIVGRDWSVAQMRQLLQNEKDTS